MAFPGQFRVVPGVGAIVADGAMPAYAAGFAVPGAP
jgi:hypothetical protein